MDFKHRTWNCLLIIRLGKSGTQYEVAAAITWFALWHKLVCWKVAMREELPLQDSTSHIKKESKLKTRFPSYPVARFVYQMANSRCLLIDLIDSFQQQKKNISRVR